MTQSARSQVELAPPIATLFLARHGMAGVQLEPLAGDASARRYYRLPGKGLLLMEDREDLVGFAGYVRVSRHLLQLGLSAPRVHGADPSNGLGLVEDFGAGTYSHDLSKGANETELYTLAVDALSHDHKMSMALRLPARNTTWKHIGWNSMFLHIGCPCRYSIA